MRNVEEIIHNGKTVKQILDEHVKWLRGEEGGRRANLTGADLTRTDLTGADLTEASLTKASLRDADLTGASLREANLTGTDLTWAKLTGTDLREADLARANLFNVVGKEIIVFQFGQHFAYSCDGNIKIGCQEHSIEWWKDHYAEAGEMYGYSDKEIEMYGMFINMC